jgi:hypothetical protein
VHALMLAATVKAISEREIEYFFFKTFGLMKYS